MAHFGLKRFKTVHQSSFSNYSGFFIHISPLFPLFLKNIEDFSPKIASKIKFFNSEDSCPVQINTQSIPLGLAARDKVQRVDWSDWVIVQCDQGSIYEDDSLFHVHRSFIPFVGVPKQVDFWFNPF